MDKLVFLTPKQAAEAGYFSSAHAAAHMRSRGIGPRYSKPTARRVLYARADLDAWARSHVHLTAETLPLGQRRGTGR